MSVDGRSLFPCGWHVKHRPQASRAGMCPRRVPTMHSMRRTGQHDTQDRIMSLICTRVIDCEAAARARQQAPASVATDPHESNGKQMGGQKRCLQVV